MQEEKRPDSSKTHVGFLPEDVSLGRGHIRGCSKGPGKGPRIVERKIRIYGRRKECAEEREKDEVLA